MAETVIKVDLSYQSGNMKDTIIGYQHKAGHLCSAGSRPASLIATLR